MADKTLAVLVRTAGARAAARELDRVSGRVRDIGQAGKDASKNVNMFERALRLLGTRMGIVIILGGLMTLTLGPPMIAVIALLTAALVTLGAVMVPVFILGAGAMARFEATADKAGTAANALQKRIKAFSRAFRYVVAPGADILFRKLGEALLVLHPVMQTMKGPLTMFARLMGDAIVTAAEGVARLGPEFRSLLTASAPLLANIGALIGPLVGVFIDVGRAGVPVLAQLVKWITDFIVWLRPAIQDLIAFGQSSQAADLARQWIAGAAAAAKYLWDVLVALWPIAVELWNALAPTVLPALLAGLGALLVVLQWVSKNISWLLPLAAALVALFIWFVAPIGGVVLSVGLLIAALVILYNKVAAVRWVVRAVINVIKFLWGIMKVSPLGLLIQNVIKLVRFLWRMAGGWDGIKAAFTAMYDWIKPKIDALVDIIQKLWDKTKGVRDVLGDVAGMATPGGDTGLGSKAGILGVGGVPIIGTGGTIKRGGAAIVGDRGPEAVNLPTGTRVTSNRDLVRGGGDQMVAVTLVMPDGQILAQQTLKASRKRQASR